MSFKICKTCSKRKRCKWPCRAVEKHLAKEYHGLFKYKEKASQRDFKHYAAWKKKVELIIKNKHLMNPTEQQITYLRYVNGFALKEIAFILKKSYSSIKSYLVRIRKKYA